MKRLLRILTKIGTILTFVLLVGCGQNYDSTGATGSPVPTGTNDAVSLSVDAASYHPGNTISVTLKNQGKQTIYFVDHLSSCTIIQLEMQVNGTWKMVNQCMLASPTGWYSLDAGKSMTVKLVSVPDRPWTSGLYRATLSYAFSRTIGYHAVIHSAGFQVA